jgi:hypothetical protein
MENMLVQIMQMLKDQNLRLNKIESSIKMTWQSLMANGMECEWTTAAPTWARSNPEHREYWHMSNIRNAFH